MDLSWLFYCVNKCDRLRTLYWLPWRSPTPWWSSARCRASFISRFYFTAEITTSALEKQTSALLQFYFRFLFWPHHRNRHVILHQTAKFHSELDHPRWSNNVLSIFKMATVSAQYYFRFRMRRRRCFQKVKMYMRTKFRRHISIYGWDITTSGL